MNVPRRSKKIKTSRQKFHVRLRALGFSTYSEYLSSDYWTSIRSEYAESNLPKRCLACGAGPYQLHHRSYERLGREILLDLIPLCRSCHVRLHNLSLGPLTTPHQAIRKMAGISKGQAKNKVAPLGMKSKVGWIPRGLTDLRRMRSIMGVKAFETQHRRLFPGEPVPVLSSSNPVVAKSYAKRLSGYR